MRKVFAAFDRDGNGKIDKLELREVFADMGKFFPESDIQQMIDSADADQSGALEYEEFIEVVLGKKLNIHRAVCPTSRRHQGCVSLSFKSVP